MDIQPFMIHIPQADLDDLQTRLERTRFTDEIPGSGSDYGVSVEWVKPPGESDSSSSFIPQGPENPGGKGFDRMCDPTYTGNQLNGNNMTGALPNAPVSGRWFQAQFAQLVQNAYPPFP